MIGAAGDAWTYSMFVENCGQSAGRRQVENLKRLLIVMTSISLCSSQLLWNVVGALSVQQHKLRIEILSKGSSAFNAEEPLYALFSLKMFKSPHSL